jgi:hypothetical protein
MTEESRSERTVAIILNRDLMFGSRIRGALAHLGLDARFVPTTAAFVQALETTGAESAIAIIDMNGAVEWDALAVALSSDFGRPPVLGFGPHTDVENRRAAKQAGVSRIVTNGQFQEGMADLISRYKRT